jgi:hypothetical protein
MGSLVEVVAVPDGADASAPSSVFHFKPGSFFRNVSSTFVAVMREVEAEVSMGAKRGSML